MIALCLGIVTLVELIALVLLLRLAKKKGIIKSKIDLKKVKLEQWIVFSVYVLVVGFILYIALSNFVPGLMKPVNSGKYIIDGSADILKSFYFEKEVFGEKVEIDGEEYFSFDSEEINKIVFTPKKIISESLGVLEIEGVNKGTDLYIEDKLVVPNLENYVKVKDYSDSEVYVRKDYVYGSLEDYGKLEDFLYYNFPQAEVYSFKSLDDSVPVLMDYEMEDTRIEGPFRDNLNLVVYHGGGVLRIRGEKQDLNMYVGKDEYALKIKNFDGEEVYSKVLKDDGESRDTKEILEEQDFSTSVSLERGIYYIEFVKDKNNNGGDSTIKNLIINSNKVLIKGKFLPWGKNQRFFTKVFDTKEIGFRYWWKDYNQNIYFTGNMSFTLNLNEKNFEKYIYEELSKGDYYFRIEKGHLETDCDYTSFSEENWFNIPVESENKMFAPDVLVVDKNVLRIDGEKFYLKFDIEIKDEFKFQVLDAGKLFIKKIELKV